MGGGVSLSSYMYSLRTACLCDLENVYSESVKRPEQYKDP